MKLLLDTYVWLWSLLEPERLTPRVTRALRSEHNELWLSPISVWEFLVLAERGRVITHDDPAVWLDHALERAPMREAPLTHDIAIESRRLGLPHQDPADRFLAATARVFELTLVTSDERLLLSEEVSVLPNR